MRQTLSAEEAQAVVRLQLESSGEASRVRVEDLAETLGISPEEVEILLARAQRGHAEAAQAQMEHHRRRDLRRVIAAFVCAVLIVGGGFGFYRYREAQRAREDIAGTGQEMDEALGAIDRLARDQAKREMEEAAANAAVPPIPPVPGASPDELTAPPLRMFFGKGVDPQVISIEGLSMEQVAPKVEEWAAKQRKPKARSVEADEATIRSLEEHDYNDPGLARPAITFQNDRISNELVLPIYSGTNPEVERKAAEERWRVIGEGMHIDAPYPGSQKS